MKTVLYCTVLAILPGLAACQEARQDAARSADTASRANQAASATPPSRSASLYEQAAQGKGFVTPGHAELPVAYVFFDAQNQPSADLWRELKPYRDQVRFMWIPVRLVNEQSLLQGATLLASPDPMADMDEHEESLTGEDGGIDPEPTPPAARESIARNTDLMNRMGLSGLPAVVGKHSSTGAPVKHEGPVKGQALAQMLGLRVATGQK